MIFFFVDKFTQPLPAKRPLGVGLETQLTCLHGNRTHETASLHLPGETSLVLLAVRTTLCLYGRRVSLSLGLIHVVFSLNFMR